MQQTQVHRSVEMNIKQTILIFFIISLLISSCEKNEPFGGNDHYLLNESLYPLLFDVNSYWVYENNETGTFDSLYLVENIMDTMGPTNVGHGYSSTYQVFNLKYASNINGEYTEHYVGSVITKGSTDGGFLYFSSFWVGDSRRNATISSILDSLELNGNVYKDVVVMDVKKDLYINDDMNLYYVDSIGVIKKEIKEGNAIISTWGLTDYSIKYLK